jgi:uncharacterized protein (TIGR03085 family)
VTQESLARRERAATCDLALELGESAPTLCTGWDAKDLMVHLIVRERRPHAAVGIVIPRFSRITEREAARWSALPFTDLVDRVRKPGLTPLTLPGVDRLANSVEFFVHHEDLRRAQPGWEPRPMPSPAQDLFWTAARLLSRRFLRRLSIPVTLVRGDGGSTAVIRSGNDPVTLTGPPTELVLFLYGREENRVEITGPDDAVATVRTADRGI